MRKMLQSFVIVTLYSICMAIQRLRDTIIRAFYKTKHISASQTFLLRGPFRIF
jgi:hypothetical protein